MTSIENYLTILQYLTIIGFCSYSVVLTIKWLIEIRSKYTPLVIGVKLFHGIVSLIWIAVYVYSLMRIILGNGIDVNYYGINIVRPAIIITSIYFAIAAKVRYFIAKHREDSCLMQR
jgi:hypothetical protein